MINYYIIKEKIVYLYIDYNYEFGIDFNIKHKYSNMKKEIKKYLKQKGLLINGEKIALVFGGVVLALLLVIENPKVLDSYDLVYVNNSIIPKEVNISLEKEESIESKKENVEIDTTVNPKVNNSVKENVNDVNNVNNINAVYTTNDTKDIPSNKEIIIEEPKNTIEEEVDDNKIYVTVHRTNGSILNLELEEYLVGVVGAEMPASFNIEALKVQAIISRTYALKSLKIGRKLTDNTNTQVYKDNDELKSMWGNDYNKYYSKIKEAVDSTKGIAIYYNNDLIDALFFATSNGKTEDSKYVWGNSIPYLVSVDSSWDKDTTPYVRTVSKEVSDVLNILGVDNSNYNIISKDDSGRVLEISFGDKIFSGVEFRNLLGLRSSDFDLEIDDSVINITTRGYGHGVGLSQYGAGKMAANGNDYKEIIKHYYTGVDVR